MVAHGIIKKLFTSSQASSMELDLELTSVVTQTSPPPPNVSNTKVEGGVCLSLSFSSTSTGHKAVQVAVPMLDKGRRLGLK